MNISEATATMALLQAYFPTRPLPDSTVAVWAESLLDYEAADAAEAVRLLAQDSVRLPSLGQLLDETRNRRKIRLRGSARDRELAGLAWGSAYPGPIGKDASPADDDLRAAGEL